MRPEDVPEVREDSFRYPGPKPCTKESAIVSLADGIESASRSLERPTPQRIDDLVSSIIRERLSDGQLNDAPLTLADLQQIGDSFKNSLVNMLHARPAYPKREEKVVSVERKTARPAA
jgi:membrane-associated HD superfamily phosphohydrolase